MGLITEEAELANQKVLAEFYQNLYALANTPEEYEMAKKASEAFSLYSSVQLEQGYELGKRHGIASLRRGLHEGYTLLQKEGLEV